MSHAMPPELERLVLVTGTARSGKSLISRVLRTSSEFAYFAEPLDLWSVIPLGRDDDRLRAADATPDVARGLCARCASAVAAQNKRAYLDDYAYHALAVPFIHEVFPHTKIIHVIRDPVDLLPQLIWGWQNRDTITKAVFRRRSVLNFRTLPRYAVRFMQNYLRSRIQGRRESYGPRVPGMKEFAADHGIAEIAAYQWEQMVRIAREDLAQLPSNRWLEVRFERLITDTASEYRRIAEFAELEDVDAIADYGTDFVEPDRVVDTRIEPTAEEWERIWERIGELAKELGYSPRFRDSNTTACGGAV